MFHYNFQWRCLGKHPGFIDRNVLYEIPTIKFNYIFRDHLNNDFENDLYENN